MAQFYNTMIQSDEVFIQKLAYLLNKHNKVTTKTRTVTVTALITLVSFKLLQQCSSAGVSSSLLGCDQFFYLVQF